MPIIAITAAGMKEDIYRIQQAGFDDYLIRPFNKQQLYHKLSSFLQLKKQTSHMLKKGGVDVQQNLGETDTGYLSNWECEETVALQLRDHYLQTWHKICKKQRIPDIQKFSQEIQALGERHSIEVLTNYSNVLKGYTETVDIDKLESCLADFPLIVEQMKISTSA